MGKKKKIIVKNVRLSKFVHGGQALGTVEKDVDSKPEQDNKKQYNNVKKLLLVWGGLPGELVVVRITKKRKSYKEGIVIDVLEPSPQRIDPIELDSYLSTSPWQIVREDVEPVYKDEILKETFEREGLSPSWQPFSDSDKYTGYRSKMEFGFWGNDDGLHLAHYVRGSHGKQMVESSVLATDSVNSAAQSIRDELNRLSVWGSDLKSLVVRSSQSNEVVAALYIKNKIDLDDLKLPEGLKGMAVYYSDPKSPASVTTEDLMVIGDISLSDELMGTPINYDVNSFFQVNLPVFESVLRKIDELTKGEQKIDMYSGVGAIGAPLDGTAVLVESDDNNIVMAEKNVGDKEIIVVHASSENAVEHIHNDKVLIVDPPRAGLHKNVIEAIIQAKPPKIVYLSCNPSTQARDVGLLREEYEVGYAQGFNFFPRTPHIESLIIMERKDEAA